MKRPYAILSVFGLMIGIAGLAVPTPASADLPYPTAATVSELVADINYANNTGGAFTINLNPGTNFELYTYLPVVGSSKAVDLTIIGNGGNIERVGSEAYNLVSVAPGASLTLDDITLKGGYVANLGGGAIFNRGTLTVRDSTLSGNHASGRSFGGAILNSGGTVTVSSSTFTANYADGGNGGSIYNGGGVVTVSNSRFFGNWVSPGYSAGGRGGGIYNDATGTLIVQHSSSIEGNYATNWDQGAYSSDVHNDGVVYQDNTSTIHTLHGNPAILLDPAPGDYNNDGKVDAADLARWGQGFGTSGTATPSQGDADGDADVDGADFLVWQRGVPGLASAAIAPSAVPEPAAIISLLFGITGLGALVRRRPLAIGGNSRLICDHQSDLPGRTIT